MKPEPTQPTARVPSLGKLLVMDDEMSVRETCRLLLQHLGYEVVVAAAGETAIDFYLGAKAAGKPFDAVLLDLTVRGGMGGKEASGILRARDPDVRMIVMSGYRENDIMCHHAEHGFKGALPKPFDRETLHRALEHALQR